MNIPLVNPNDYSLIRESVTKKENAASDEKEITDDDCEDKTLHDNLNVKRLDDFTDHELDIDSVAKTFSSKYSLSDYPLIGKIQGYYFPLQPHNTVEVGEMHTPIEIMNNAGLVDEEDIQVLILKPTKQNNMIFSTLTS